LYFEQESVQHDALPAAQSLKDAGNAGIGNVPHYFERERVYVSGVPDMKVTADDPAYGEQSGRSMQAAPACTQVAYIEALRYILQIQRQAVGSDSEAVPGMFGMRREGKIQHVIATVV